MYERKRISRAKNQHLTIPIQFIVHKYDIRNVCRYPTLQSTALTSAYEKLPLTSRLRAALLSDARQWRKSVPLSPMRCDAVCTCTAQLNSAAQGLAFRRSVHNQSDCLTQRQSASRLVSSRLLVTGHRASSLVSQRPHQSEAPVTAGRCSEMQSDIWRRIYSNA